MKNGFIASVRGRKLSMLPFLMPMLTFVKTSKKNVSIAREPLPSPTNFALDYDLAKNRSWSST